MYIVDTPEAIDEASYGKQSSKAMMRSRFQELEGRDYHKVKDLVTFKSGQARPCLITAGMKGNCSCILLHPFICFASCATYQPRGIEDKTLGELSSLSLAFWIGLLHFANIYIFTPAHFIGMLAASHQPLTHA
jgi:hypothetical protein